MLARFLVNDQWRHVIVAEDILLALAEDLEAGPPVLDLPDDPGAWWMFRDVKAFSEWRMVYVLQ